MGADCCSRDPPNDALSCCGSSTVNQHHHSQAHDCQDLEPRQHSHESQEHNHALSYAHNHPHGSQEHHHSLSHAHSHDHPAAHTQHDEHAHCVDQDDCAAKGEICDDAACCAMDDTCTSTTLTCCDTNDEHCDEKCIIAAAAFECEKACEVESEIPDAHLIHRHIHDDFGRHPKTACNEHLAKAFDQYTAYLESARCICRTVLERGWTKTCCGTQLRVKPLRKRALPATASFNSARAHHHHAMKRRDRTQPHHLSSDNGSCCQDIQKDSCCGDKRSCCSNEEHFNHGSNLFSQSEHTVSEETYGIHHQDIEGANHLQHLTLNVEGMTCSGCGNKLEKGLKGLFGVSNVRVNFVMGQAECIFDASLTTADQVMRNAERATSFHCTKLSTDDQTLDILASGPVAKRLVDHLDIPGVIDVSIVSMTSVRINYDPTIIGARNLLLQLPPGIGGLAPPRLDPSVSRGRKRLWDQLIKSLLSAVFTIPVLIMAWGNVVGEPTKAIVSMILATFVQSIAIPDFYRPALSSLFYSRVVEMDMLVVISITAAYFYSLVAFGFRMAGHPLKTAEFFETSTLLITLVILGRLVAAYARVRAVKAVSLRSLQASSAVVVENGQDKEIDARLLQYGDKFKIGPHKTIPTDGIVLSGSSDIDESMLTGESVPLFKKQGDEIIAGTTNGTGTLVARLTRLPGKSTVTDIAKMVEEAANSKPRLQYAADCVARKLVHVVGAVAIIVLAVWVVVGIKVRNYSSSEAISNAITYAVATLAVSCPCGLGLAVPMVLVVAGGIAARSGVIIKSAECTERARKVTDVVFDKTGTITETELDVLAEEFLDGDEALALAITRPLVAGNNHPVSLGVCKHMESRAVKPAAVTDIHVIPGAGVEAVFQGNTVRAGNPTWTGVDDDPTVKSLKDQGLTLLVVTCDSKPIAVYGLCTRLRPEASKVVEKLISRGITVHVVSGDLQPAVEAVAAQVGIPHVAAQRTPSQKRDYVAALMKERKNVMFVGDGTNDAVAVMQADVGVQIASALSASEVTRGAADVVLLKSLEGIPFVLELSCVSFRRMVFNFVWSAIYNVLAIMFASGALVRVRLPPAYAGVGEIVSVLPVILAAMTMLLTKIKTE